VNSSLIVFLPLLGAGIAFLIGSATNRHENARAVAVIFAVATALVALAVAVAPGFGGAFSVPWVPGFLNFQFNPDTLSMSIALCASLIGALIVIYSTEYIAHYDGLTRYWSLLLMFIGAMCGLVLSGNILQMFFFWEIVGVCSYALIGFEFNNPKAGKGGLKAFVTTKVGDIGLFAGILLLYSLSPSHTFEFSKLAQEAAKGSIPEAGLLTAGFLLMMGAIGKSAQVPLHVWLPDAMEAPTSVSALIHAATMVNSGVYLMARVQPIFGEFHAWSTVLAYVGALTAIIGSGMAVYAGDLKRMLAYSTVSQLGIMMFGVGSGNVSAATFHLVNHAIFKAALFLSAGAVIHEVGTREMSKMGGLRERMPRTAFAYLIGTLALSGIPPFNGFWSKDMILAAGLHSGQYIPLALAAMASMLTFFYSMRAYFRVFTGDVSAASSHAHEVGTPITGPLTILAVGAMVSWLGVEAITKAGEEHIGIGELLHETFLPTGIVMTVVILGIGYLLFSMNRKKTEEPVGSFADSARAGFYFDDFYISVTNAGGQVLGAITSFLDNTVLDGIGKAVIAGSFGLAKGTRKVHTGDANYGLMGVVVGLLVIGIIVFLEMRVLS
jgi:NADH-quinone oxidoreductase subunit L